MSRKIIDLWFVHINDINPFLKGKKPVQQNNFDAIFYRNMFDLPNKRGSEVVLHLLFEKLNPVMCKEEFR